MSEEGGIWEARRAKVESHPSFRGLRYVEVKSAPTDEAPLTLRLRFLDAPPGSKKSAVPVGLNPRNVRVEGPFGELRAESVVQPKGEYAALDVQIPGVPLEADTQGFAPSYLVQIVDRPDVDPFFASASFVLPLPGGQYLPLAGKTEVPDAQEPPTVDYLNKDYESFRGLMLSALSGLDHAGGEESEAELGQTIVEALAYAADGLSYYQDAVGTERSLATARLRVSVRRHLWLAGYRLHEGCNARAWVQVAVEEPLRLPAGARFVAHPVLNAPPRIGERAYGELLEAGLVSSVFESMEDALLHPKQNRMNLYNWGAEEFVLEAGCTKAALEGHVPGLREGSVVVFETADPAPRMAHAVRLAAPGRHGKDPLYDHAITELVWNREDALPAPMAAGNGETIALGNVVLADHGRRVEEVRLPSRLPEEEFYRPLLPDCDVTFAMRRDPASRRSASYALLQEPHRAVAQVRVRASSRELAEGEDFVSRPDLLTDGAEMDGFVVEVETDRRATLRFADGKPARRPEPGAAVEATYRVGNGTAGNVVANAISHVVSDDPRVRSARNPVAATGGQDPQYPVQAGHLGPELHKSRWSLIVEKDYSDFVLGFPEVQGVHVERVWRSGRSSLHIYVQRTGGRAVEEGGDFLADIAARIEARRQIGEVVRVRPARYVPLALDLRFVPAPGVPAWQARQALAEAFAPSGEGFFAPSRTTFRTPVSRKAVVERAMRCPEVASARVERLTAIGRGESSDAVRLRDSEIPRLDPGIDGVLSIDREDA